jgi:hypothetical protein
MKCKQQYQFLSSLTIEEITTVLTAYKNKSFSISIGGFYCKTYDNTIEIYTIIGTRTTSPTFYGMLSPTTENNYKTLIEGRFELTAIETFLSWLTRILPLLFLIGGISGLVSGDSITEKGLWSTLFPFVLFVGYWLVEGFIHFWRYIGKKLIIKFMEKELCAVSVD